MTPEAVTPTSFQLPPRQSVELILNRLDQLPTIPAVAARLLAVTAADDTDARDVARVVESDASLTALILRMVRRADLGIRGETMTAARAIAMLGFRTVRNAVLSVRLFETFPRREENERACVVRRGLWEHSLAVACLAELLGDRIGGPRMSGEAFVCGLLHDIGKIALDACLPKSYARIVERVEREFACICDVERSVVGLDHTVAGKRLATRWRLPDAVVECVWVHHQDIHALPTGVAFPRHVQLIHLADNVVRREGIGFSGYQHIADIAAVAASLSLSLDEVETAVGQLAERMAPYRELLGIFQADDDRATTAALTRANRQLADANAALTEANHALSIRAQLLAAIEQFIESVHDDDTPGDICMKAARTVRGLVGGSAAAAFVADATSGCIFLGFADAQRQDAAVLGAREEDANRLNPGHWERGSTGFTRAHADVVWIWDHCRIGQPGEPLWFLPSISGGGSAAGLLVSAMEERIRPFHSAPDACATFSACVARALRLSLGRGESERMTEELFELNRRLQAAKQELVRTRSLSMIAAMAAGAAHELNNPLSVISGRAQLARQTCDDEDLARSLDVIIEQSHKASQIVTELMDFAKPEPPQPRSHLLRDLLDSLGQRWRKEFGLRPEQLTVALNDPAVRVFVDQTQFEFAFSAVVANAVQAAAPSAAHININSPSRATDEFIRTVVADNGVGMTREVLEHALDPFYSHREAGRGRGLGLSRTYRLIEINGGRMRIDSAPHAGTKVTIELPANPPQS